MAEQQLRIEGMTCNHCRMAVDKALRAVPGVHEVDVRLDPGQARVEGEALDTALLQQAVEKAGYRVTATS